MCEQEIVKNQSPSQSGEQNINITENFEVESNEFHKKPSTNNPESDCNSQSSSSINQEKQIGKEKECNNKQEQSQQEANNIYDNFNNYQKQFQHLQSASGSRIKPILPNHNKFNCNQQSKRSDQEIESQQLDDQVKYEQLKQKLQFNCVDIQVLQEIQYYVYQDLANVLGILQDTCQTLQHFSGQENADYVTVALNKLILQINLSNGIHYDCLFNFQTQTQKELYNLEKQKAKQLFGEILQNFQIPQNEVVQNCINQYLKNLNPNIELKQIISLQMKPRSQFNQKVVQTIFDGMRTVGDTQQQIKQGVYKKLEKSDIEQMLNYRKERAKLLLQKNFPSQTGNNCSQEHYQQQDLK